MRFTEILCTSNKLEIHHNYFARPLPKQGVSGMMSKYIKRHESR